MEQKESNILSIAIPFSLRQPFGHFQDIHRFGISRKLSFLLEFYKNSLNIFFLDKYIGFYRKIYKKISAAFFRKVDFQARVHCFPL